MEYIIYETNVCESLTTLLKAPLFSPLKQMCSHFAVFKNYF
jgi:hypothetical protein